MHWIAAHPIAHRGLHDSAMGIFENTLSAARAAASRGYAIEVDLHPSADRVPMVFHDNTLDRLTAERGPVRARSAAELGAITIGGTSDHVPTLAQLLEAVAGRVGLVLELKGIAGEDEGFAAAVLDVLSRYQGNVAIMSFNHWLLEDARIADCRVPLGLTAEGGESLAGMHMEAADRYRADFISYDVDALPHSFVQSFRRSGKPAITWTVRNHAQVMATRAYADQMTFEGFLPPAG